MPVVRRRAFIGTALAAGGAGLLGLRYWPEDGLWNPCFSHPIPESLLKHELVLEAWEGIEASQRWDCHVHLIGNGKSGSGIWLNPAMDSLWHPVQRIQKQFYLNAGCVEDGVSSDGAYVSRLVELQKEMPGTGRAMLLAFDYHHDSQRRRVQALSPFYTPNDYAARVAQGHPDQFQWIASIHPYRKDAVARLEDAVKRGARGVKWLPPAMGMDPASPRCDAFYAAMARLNVPLLSHGGKELAVHSGEYQALANPLRLRRPLDQGVRVVVAHCASLGQGRDMDRGPNGPMLDNFELFSRMMDEPRYQGRLFGEISAMVQYNRVGRALHDVITREDWHGRLVNGSDYPLPGIMPLISLRKLVGEGFLDGSKVAVISALRRYNPLMFDFVLKRHLRRGGRGLAASVFESRRVFG
ncbi:MAG: amidohydrolase family protein [Gammaproteobacteria bacterium]|nr:amidohydrolase family protein [Gammaproteobacteria bacterium]